MTVAIMGCGGHGQSIGDFLRERGTVVVYLDDEPNGFPVIGGSEKLEDERFINDHEIVVGIGDNKIRHHFSLTAVAAGGRMLTVKHRMATINQSSKYGIGCQFFPGAIVGANVRLGDFVIINNHSSVGHDSVVADAAQIADGATLGGRVWIGYRTLVGMNAVVLPKIKVGDDCIIGAGAVVTRDVPDRSIVYGNPARAHNAAA